MHALPLSIVAYVCHVEMSCQGRLDRIYNGVTSRNIQRAALDEFGAKGVGGFLAPDRQSAIVTARTLYVYFPRKEAVCASIVDPHAAALMGRLTQAQTAFAELPEFEQPHHMGLVSSPCIQYMSRDMA